MIINDIWHHSLSWFHPSPAHYRSQCPPPFSSQPRPLAGQLQISLLFFFNLKTRHKSSKEINLTGEGLLNNPVCWGNFDNIHMSLLCFPTPVWAHAQLCDGTGQRYQKAESGIHMLWFYIHIFMNCYASNMNENHGVFFWSSASFSSINFGFIKQRLCWISFEWRLCWLLRKVFLLIFWLL